MNTSQFLGYLSAHPATRDLSVEVTAALALRRDRPRPVATAPASTEQTRIAS